MHPSLDNRLTRGIKKVKTVLIIGLILVATGVSAIGQFPQSRRVRERLDQSIRASEETEHDRRLEETNALPVPKKAVMNVDVQMVLSKNDHKTFAEAKAAEARKAVDGEPLWMYLKFKGKLGDYVLTTRNPEDPEKLRYTLFAEIAPRGDVTALHQVTLQFAKEDLPATELKFNLAPGLFGRNKSIPIYLMTSGSAKTGVWNNEVRVTNTLAMPRGLTDNLASTPVTLELSGGSVKYRKMDTEYDSLVLRGTTDVTKMPFPGTFFNEDLKTRVITRLAADNIKPVKVYFSGDDWQEYSSFGVTMKKYRKIFATFTYREAETCFYGVAEIIENYDFLNSKYGEGEIKLQKNIAVPCAEIG